MPRGAALVPALLALVAAACGGAGATTAPSPSATGIATLGPATPKAVPPTSAPTTGALIALPVEPGSTVEGLIEVNGHAIYARCAGTGVGGPTVVYFTGWADDLDKRGVAIAHGLEQALGDAIRLCSYERRNTGRSEQVEGTQTPEDVIADIDGVLAGLGEEGPFVLLGASYGGEIGALYAVAHPDRVAAIVNLDGSSGVERELEEISGDQGACLEANRHADAFESQEKLDNCSISEFIRDHRDLEPDVPLLYLASRDSEYSEAAQRLVKAWIETWSPGEWRAVDAPHWMDEANTDLVADAVREVIGLVD